MSVMCTFRRSSSQNINSPNTSQNYFLVQTELAETFGLLESWALMSMNCAVEAVRGQVWMCNLGKARADYAVKGTRIEQRRPSSECSKLVAGVRRRFVRLNPWMRRLTPKQIRRKAGRLH